MNGILRRQAPRLVALGLVVMAYAIARAPDLSVAERRALASSFAFSHLEFPQSITPATRSIRSVHPSLQHIDAWISSVGAAVLLGDLDGDALPNDLCWVDPRADSVSVAPVPGTSRRYAAHELDPAPLPFDRATMAPMGVLAGDFDEDGGNDLLVYYWGRTPIVFLRRGAGYVPVELMPRVERWYTNAATRADLDGDGHVDLVLGNYFEDGARILDTGDTGGEHMHDSMSRAHNGGSTRLLLWEAGRGGAGCDVRFRDVSDTLDDPRALGWTLAVAAGDLDGDLLPELYLANDFGSDLLLHNRSSPGVLRWVALHGRKTLGCPSSCVVGRDSFKGMGVDFGDINGDGLLDIYVSNITVEYGLQESQLCFISTGDLDRMQRGDAPYVNRAEELGLARTGWGWDVRLADFDNDGVLEALQATGFVRGETNRWPELHEIAMGNDGLLSRPGSWHRFRAGDDLSGHEPNAFFVRGPGGRFVDLAPELDLDQPQVTRGIAIADVDGDGDLDFAVANQWQPSVFHRNDRPADRAFLGLRLLLPLGGEPDDATVRLAGHAIPSAPARPAIGALATVHLPDGRRMVAHVDGGNGHSGVRSPDLHFGLGALARTAQLRVEIQWRDRHGRACRDSLSLAPGWHTVVLGGAPRAATGANGDHSR